MVSDLATVLPRRDQMVMLYVVASEYIVSTIISFCSYILHEDRF